MGALSVETLLGFLTTTASVIAFAKLQEMMPTRPLTYQGQNVVSLVVLGGAVVMGVDADGGLVRPVSVDVPGLHRIVAAVRHSAGDPHRRRGHAHRDRAVEFLRRSGRRGHGLRAG